MSRTIAALFALTVAVAWATPERAFAYCRTSACPNDEVGARCTPAVATDCGTPLFWPEPCVSFSVQKAGSPSINADAFAPIAKSAFSAWMNADCGNGSHPRITVSDLGTVSCDRIEYNAKGANNNAIIFRTGDWPYPATNALALTTVTYNLDTGEIRDADMELNAADVTFSTGDTNVTVDLSSIVTHEAGHFLGLAHSSVPDATMDPNYPPKSISLRTLEADDQSAICDVYPPGVISTCDPTPKGGLGDACKSPAVIPPSTGCCAIAVGSDAGYEGTVAVLLGALGVSVRLSRRGQGPRARRPRRGASDRPRCRGCRS